MDPPIPDDPRLVKLLKLFNDVIYGRRQLIHSRDGRLFIEAPCSQRDNAICAHKLFSTPAGLHALQASVRFDVSITFLNGDVIPLLRYMQDPALKSIDSGSVLGENIIAIVEPPFFWDALTNSFRSGLLNPHAFRSYA